MNRTKLPKSLRFSPTAWAKLLYLRDLGETEIGGFGITELEDLLYVGEILLVEQVCTMATVAFDDASVASFFDEQVDLGLQPCQFGRVWIHTHPGKSAAPSATDEATFARVFGASDWAVMCILARGGETFARLRFSVGPGGDVELLVEIDYSRPFEASDFAGWRAEYQRSVRAAPALLRPERKQSRRTALHADWDDFMNPGDPMFDEFEYAVRAPAGSVTPGPPGAASG